MMHHNTHYVSMFGIMIVAGVLSTMNVWADKWSDMRLSLNDLYMILLMTGWMFLFMGLIDRVPLITGAGALLAGACLWAIRMQFGITQSQYLQGMIPHHSMAVHMSRRLLDRDNTVPEFLRTIVDTQEHEINFMKSISTAK